MGWQTFWWTALGTAGSGVALLWLALVLLDPYGVLPLGLPIDRVPAASGQRYAYPALARSDRFDSAIIGNSTIRLLRPAALDPQLDAAFVNLAMNSATPWEQQQMLAEFARHHAQPRFVIFGLDKAWCRTDRPHTRLTKRSFPDWMVDENPWNDYAHHLDINTLAAAGRLLRWHAGMGAPRHALDGYTNFLPDPEEYDLERARRNLYGDGPREPRSLDDQAPVVTLEERRSFRFPDHELWERTVEMLPEQTRRILVFVPLHRSDQPPPGSRERAVLEECKQRMARVATRRNGIALDYLIDSPITREDANYWDPMHYTTAIADEMTRDVVAVVRGESPAAGSFQLLDLDVVAVAR